MYLIEVMDNRGNGRIYPDLNKKLRISLSGSRAKMGVLRYIIENAKPIGELL